MNENTIGVYDIGLEVKITDGILLLSVRGSDIRAVQRVQVHHMLHGLTAGHPRPQGSICIVFPEPRLVEAIHHHEPRLIKAIVYPILVHAIKCLSLLDFDSVPSKVGTARTKIETMKDILHAIQENVRYDL